MTHNHNNEYFSIDNTEGYSVPALARINAIMADLLEQCPFYGNPETIAAAQAGDDNEDHYKHLLGIAQQHFDRECEE